IDEMEARARVMEDAVSSAEESHESLRAIEAYTESVERYASLGGEDLEARAAAVLESLGLGESALGRSIDSLSGGQRARAQLAGLLLARFDIFLLDEPTNDLDFAGLELLERFVDEAPRGMMIVSHDRAFLEQCVTSVLELDGVTGAAKEFAGGYDPYVRERRAAKNAQAESYERYRNERKRLEEEARRQRTWAASGAARAKRSPSDPDKSIKAGRIQGAENIAAKAKTVERRIERLEAVDKPWEPWRLELSFGDAPRGADIVSRLEGVMVKLGDFRLGPLDVDVRWGDRVLITGANGSGKSTLLSTLTGDRPLAAGRRRIGPGLRFGSMDQNRAAFDDERPWLEVFRARCSLTEEAARSLLAKFALSADHVAGEIAVARRAKPGHTGPPGGPRGPLPPRRAHQPPGSRGDRATRERPGHLRRDDPPGDARPEADRGVSSDPQHRVVRNLTARRAGFRASCSARRSGASPQPRPGTIPEGAVYLGR
ncbi:MAG: ATP-binding cassette domain-containing protein, partial [Actinomycetota bacterium]